MHPGVIGRRIEVVADLDRVRVLSDGKTVADHERVWAWHQTITDPQHLRAANALRRNRVGALRPVREGDLGHCGHRGDFGDSEITVQQRPLADYDTALGIDVSDGGCAS